MARRQSPQGWPAPRVAGFTQSEGRLQAHFLVRIVGQFQHGIPQAGSLIEPGVRQPKRVPSHAGVRIAERLFDQRRVENAESVEGVKRVQSGLGNGAGAEQRAERRRPPIYLRVRREFVARFTAPGIGAGKLGHQVVSRGFGNDWADQPVLAVGHSPDAAFVALCDEPALLLQISWNGCVVLDDLAIHVHDVERAFRRAQD